MVTNPPQEGAQPEPTEEEQKAADLPSSVPAAEPVKEPAAAAAPAGEAGTAPADAGTPSVEQTPAAGSAAAVAPPREVTQTDQDPAAPTAAAEIDAAKEDFEGAGVEPDWGMTGGLKSRLSLKKDETDGNTYLASDRGEKELNTGSATVKSFADLPVAMASATLSFRFKVDELKTNTGKGGVAVYLGDQEILGIYCAGDLRTEDGKPQSQKLMYSVGGYNMDTAVTTERTIARTQWYEVKFELDFANHTASVYWGDETLAEDISLGETIQSVNGIGFALNGKKFRTQFGLDDFIFTYTASNVQPEEGTNLLSLEELPAVTVDSTQWAGGYQHPTSATATLVNGQTYAAGIDGATWTSEPAFDPAVKGIYTWTAALAADAQHANPRGLKASYTMNYLAVVNHDYQNYFTVDADVWAKSPLGSDIDSVSGSGSLALSRKEENGVSYLYAEANNTGHRGQRLALTDEQLKSADVAFDWMPVLTSGEGFGEVMLFAPDSRNSYFTVRFDKDYDLSVYTKCSLPKTSTVQAVFNGSLDEENALQTGLDGQNTWFHVSVHLDYVAHTADVTITNKADPTKTFTKTGLPIDPTADGLQLLLLRKSKAYVGMGLDSVEIDYGHFTAADVVDITQPDDCSVAKTRYNEFAFPTEVTVKMGDGKSRKIPVGDWKADPAFDPDNEAVYTWTAELQLPEGIQNPLQKAASFRMNYTMKPYPVGVQNPTALELTFGAELPDLPKEVTVFLSDGTIDTMPVEAWVPHEEFDPAAEGTYVWGAYLKETDEYQIDRSILDHQNDGESLSWLKGEFDRKNEFHPTNDREDYHKEADAGWYKYDAYYRVHYFKNGDNYNGYARSMEQLERGVYAIQGDGGIFVAWRLMADEYGKDVEFRLYRNGEQIATLTDKTNYLDQQGKVGDTYTVETLVDNTLYTSDPYTATAENYLNIKVQKPEPQPDIKGNLAEYSLNDAGVADVDGDGRYEIIVKWYPSNGFDSGVNNRLSSPTIFDVYRMDGTPLWRLNMGLEMPSGAHFNQFMFYDLDEDGKAELFIKTSDGTCTYKPNADGVFDMTDESTLVAYVGDKSVVPGSNIVANVKGSGNNGHVAPSSNEYVTVFNGLTGEIIDSIDYVNKTESFEQWGDTYGNRSARYTIGLAYLPKAAGSTDTIPAVVLSRGYYKRTTLAAYTLRNGKLTLDWNFVAPSETTYAGKGNHNMATGDMDNDGFDEICIGALTIDHDGTVLWAKDGQENRDMGGHADSIHLAAMTPESEQLYVFSPAEDYKIANVNASITNAATGGRIAGDWSTPGDIGRGVAANITPLPGYEYWSSRPNSETPDEVPSGAICNFYGNVISTVKPRNFSTNWCAYWDGDLLSELPDAKNPSSKNIAQAVHKYNWETNEMETLTVFEGTMTNNSTKNTPCLSADLFGDWREEIMVRSADNSELRIYFTAYETDYMIYTLMQDPVYRNAVAGQNSGYNQPPHVGFYLGEDERDRVLNLELPVANIRYTTAKPNQVSTQKPTVNTVNPPADSPKETASPAKAATVSAKPVNTIPKTADTFPLAPAAMVLLASGAGLVYLIKRKRNK